MAAVSVIEASAMFPALLERRHPAAQAWFIENAAVRFFPI
jgi:hypothetical protein